MILVTSFHREGYEKYGREMLLSAIENFPGDIIAYSEDFDDWVPDVRHEKVSYRDLLDVPGCENFLSYCNANPVFQGKLFYTQSDFMYDFNHDAARFSKKVFSQFDAFDSFPGEKIIWVDADCVFKKKTTEKFWEGLFDGKAVFYMGREGFHVETGVVGFDLSHPDFVMFHSAYVLTYRKGFIFTLPYWCDGYTFQWSLEQSQVEGKNHSPNWKLGDSLDVIETTPIHEFITHKKGLKKFGSMN